MSGDARTGPRRRALSIIIGTAAVSLAAAGVAAESSKLIYMTWGGYDDPDFRKPYTDKYGPGPEFVFYSHPDEAYAKLRSGFTADVAHPCIHDVQKWQASGLLAPIDTEKVAAWNDLIPALRDAPPLVIDGRHWLVPWEWGSSSIIYRTDKVRLAEESYEALIDPAFKGMTAAPDAFDEIYQLAAVLAGVGDPLALAEGEYAAVEAKMRAIKDNLRFIWTDPSALEQAMASGEVVLAWGWPNSVKNLKAQGVPVEFMREPKEGLVTWLCGFARLASGSVSDEEAYDFINALESPESGKALVQNFGYGHANAKALALVPKEELAALGLSGDVGQFLAKGNFLGPMPEAQRRRLVEMWETIKAGN